MPDIMPLHFTERKWMVIYHIFSKQYMKKLMEIIFIYRRMQGQLMIAINNEIGDCSNPKVIMSEPKFFSKIIARLMTNIIVGEEISKCEDMIKVFANQVVTLLNLDATICHVAGTLCELWYDLYDEVLTLEHINRMVKLDSFMRESIRSFGDIDAFAFKNNTTIPKNKKLQEKPDQVEMLNYVFSLTVNTYAINFSWKDKSVFKNFQLKSIRE
ncbi:hypothetical protein Glove_97g6 [Diversispora epigaea]|uniref:Uncharacterized protein n=1 Tax=Diversispora epigaea TaxID=1348612 RepID=A0A397J4X2_9GLOM|nr:hypothetical protein Glove_97g6 [Diversispora epigaea]